MSSGTRSAAQAVIAVGAIAGAAVLALAARQGPPRLFRGNGIQPTPPTEITASGGSASPLAGSGRGLAPPPDDRLVGLLATIIELGLAAILLFFLARAGGKVLAARRLRRRELAARVPDAEFDVVDADLRDVAEELTRGADHHRGLLAEGAPRNGIVACWMEFENAASRRGASRRPSQTSSEFTLEVLNRLRVDGHAVASLAERYREARHSDHELTEEHRRGAATDLDAILASLAGATRSTGLSSTGSEGAP